MANSNAVIITHGDVDGMVCAAQLIRQEKSKYELIKDDHIHLVCTECGEVEDKPQHSAADALFISMTEQENFTLNKQQINLYGVCSHCQEAVA